MSELTSSVAPPYPAFSEKLKFYGIWVATALMLLVLPKIFGSGSALTTFSLIGISIIFSLSYNILLGQTGMLSSVLRCIALLGPYTKFKEEFFQT